MCVQRLYPQISNLGRCWGMCLLVPWTAQKSAPGYPGPVAGWSLSPTTCMWTCCEPLSHRAVFQGSPFSQVCLEGVAGCADSSSPHLLSFTPHVPPLPDPAGHQSDPLSSSVFHTPFPTSPWLWAPARPPFPDGNLTGGLDGEREAWEVWAAVWTSLWIQAPLLSFCLPSTGHLLVSRLPSVP